MAYTLMPGRQGAVVTWSFATSNLPADTGLPQYSSYMTSAAEQATIEQAFARWESVSGLDFVQVADSAAVDIRIGFGDLTATQQEPGEIGETLVSARISAGGGIGTDLPDARIYLQDPSQYLLGTDINGQLAYGAFNTPTEYRMGITLYQVALHEIGHAIGLNHDTSDQNAAMWATASLSNGDLDADDIAGVQSLYGANSGQANDQTVLHLSGTHDQYVVSDGSTYGTVQVTDTVANRDGTTVLPQIQTVAFSDGTGILDSSGRAEDVARLYRAAFARQPDVGGLEYWVQTATAGAVPADWVSMDSIAAGFASAPEFVSTYGNLDNGGFVDQLYRNVLDRDADAGGAQYWTTLLNAGTTRGSVLEDFAQSAEDRAATVNIAGDVNDAETVRLYQAAFGHLPDQAGESYWSALLASGDNANTIAIGFTETAEFKTEYAAMGADDYVGALYRNVLGRTADATEIGYWSGWATNDAGRALVLQNIADSAENRARTAAVTHDGWVFVAN